MNSEKALKSQTEELKTSFTQENSQLLTLKNQIEKHKKLTTRLKQEVNSKSQTLATYEYCLKSPNTSAYVHKEMFENKASKCVYCYKKFINTEFLERHVTRRHPQNYPKSPEKIQTSSAPNLEVILDSMKMIVNTQSEILKQSFDRQATELHSIFERHIQDSNKNRSFRDTGGLTPPLSQLGYNTVRLERLEKLQEDNDSILREQEEELNSLKNENLSLRSECTSLQLKLSQSARISYNHSPRKFDKIRSSQDFGKNPSIRYRSESGEDQDMDLL